MSESDKSQSVETGAWVLCKRGAGSSSKEPGGGEGAVLGMEAAPMDEALPELTELLQLTCDNFLSLPTAMQNKKSPTES